MIKIFDRILESQKYKRNNISVMFSRIFDRILKSRNNSRNLTFNNIYVQFTGIFGRIFKLAKINRVKMQKSE